MLPIREIWTRTYQDGRRARLFRSESVWELEVLDPNGHTTIRAPSWRTLVDAQDTLDRLVGRVPLGSWQKLV
jgi:hypothetical protein